MLQLVLLCVCCRLMRVGYWLVFSLVMLLCVVGGVGVVVYVCWFVLLAGVVVGCCCGVVMVCIVCGCWLLIACRMSAWFAAVCCLLLMLL